MGQQDKHDAQALPFEGTVSLTLTGGLWKSSPDPWSWNTVSKIPDYQRTNHREYQRERSSTESAKTRPEADCGSDHELLIA